jgi:putative ABC transport system ATP-binding protein
MSVSTNNLHYSYTSQDTLKFPDINLKGKETLLVLGSSGTGKTTFLHLLAGLLNAKTGIIKVNETNINQLSSKELDKFRGKNIGLVFQKAYFVKALTVKENLVLSLKVAGLEKDSEKVEKVLERLSILDKSNKLPNQLSVGEQQRASIARTALLKPSLILADEPTSALDNKNAESVAQLLESTAADCEANLIVVTHDMRLKNRFKNSIEL